MKKLCILSFAVICFIISLCSCAKNVMCCDDFDEEEDISHTDMERGCDDNFYWVDSIHIENPVILETINKQYFIISKEYANQLPYDATEEDVLRYPKAAVFDLELPYGFYASRPQAKWLFWCYFPWRDFQFFTNIMHPRFPKREFSKHFQEVLLTVTPDIYYVYIVRGDAFNYMTCFTEVTLNYGRKPIVFPYEQAFYRLCIPMWRYPGPGPKYERRKTE